MSKLENDLTELGACWDALEWIRDARHSTLADAWAACERGDWLLWLLGRLSGPPESEARKRLVFCVCDVAEQVLPRAGSARQAAEECLRVSRAWARGEATLEELRTARVAAYDAACDAGAAAAAAHAAAAAYADAAYAAAADAAYAAADAARAASLRASADIVRRYYPEAPALPSWVA